MKILFLDLDGCINNSHTPNDKDGYMIDPYLAFLVGKIMLAVPDLKVVLSSSWRHCKESIKVVERRVVPIFDITPDTNTCRGDEIKAWLDTHPEVTQYAILDDDNDMLPEQLPNFFQTSWEVGITEEIMNNIIKHFNYDTPHHSDNTRENATT